MPIDTLTSAAGVVFSACEQGTGVAPGTALGTTAFFALYNPAASTKRLAIGKVAVGFISGTLGAGTLYHCVNGSDTQAAPSGGTALAAQCADVGNAAAAEGLAYVGATVATPTAYRPLVTLDALTATTASQPAGTWEDVGGEIMLEPGCSYQLQAVAAAGTSPKMTVGVTWREAVIVE